MFRRSNWCFFDRNPRIKISPIYTGFHPSYFSMQPILLLSCVAYTFYSSPFCGAVKIGGQSRLLSPGEIFPFSRSIGTRRIDDDDSGTQRQHYSSGEKFTKYSLKLCSCNTFPFLFEVCLSFIEKYFEQCWILYHVFLLPYCYLEQKAKRRGEVILHKG